MLWDLGPLAVCEPLNRQAKMAGQYRRALALRSGSLLLLKRETKKL